MRKVLLLTFALVFALNATVFAAASSSKPRTSSPAPRPSTSQPAPAQTAPGYTPSAPASGYSTQAPASKLPPTAAQQPSTGGFMRNFGMFGGGMLLGSMLGGLFGFGQAGMFANVMGMIFNVLLLAGAFIGIRYIWNRVRQNNRTDDRR